MRKSTASVERIGVQVFFNTEKLVILGHSFCTSWSTGLNLAGIESHCYISNGGVGSFAGTMGNHRSVSAALSHLHSFKGFSQGADLVQLDENRVGHAQMNAFG